MNGQRRLGYMIVLLLLTATLLISAYTVILQKNYAQNTEDAAMSRDIQCADAIHRLVSDKFTRTDFETLTTMEAMTMPRYQRLQQDLNELRTLNSTRYLYTAKRGDDGRLIYLVDGLDLDAEDFAYPGTYIEEEMIPYINDALAGNTTYSKEIVDTTWGHIFTACYPVRASDGSDEIVGALCMEMDMEDTYDFLERSSRTTFRTARMAVLVTALLAVLIYLALREQRRKEYGQQEALEKAVVAADAANRAKSAFLFNMSHDIRTPLNGIIGLLEIDEAHFDDTELLRANHGKMKVSAEHLLSLINDVLQMSKLEDGTVELAHDPIALVDLTREIVTIVIDRATEAGIIWGYEKGKAEIPYPYIYGSPLHLRQIFLNIYGNCIKYTRSGGKITTVVDSLGDHDGICTYRWTISDTGVGMSEEFVQHIFEPFAQEKHDARSIYQGTGLGMSIVKSLVEKMHGTIHVSSKEGVGSTFVITIPFEIAPEPAASPALPPETEADIHGLRLLLAEDNELNAEIAETLLADEGAIVTLARDGQRAVEKFENSPAGTFDAILMDVMMPVMDGLAATRAIRALDRPDAKTVPIIAMTANAFQEDAEKCFEAGMNAHLAKPLETKKMISVIAKCCHRESDPENR